MFDATLQPINIGIAVPGEDAATETVELVVTIGIVLAGPGGQPMPLPAANVRIPVSREIGIDLGKKLAEECERLPKPSNLITANSLDGVDAAAEFAGRLRGD